MTRDLQNLLDLRAHPGYQLLQAFWAKQGQDIMQAVTKASRLAGKDESLRYQAGQWTGFDIAIGQLDRAISEMERLDENAKEQVNADELLQQIREGGKK